MEENTDRNEDGTNIWQLLLITVAIAVIGGLIILTIRTTLKYTIYKNEPNYSIFNIHIMECLWVGLLFGIGYTSFIAPAPSPYKGYFTIAGDMIHFEKPMPQSVVSIYADSQLYQKHLLTKINNSTFQYNDNAPSRKDDFPRTEIYVYTNNKSPDTYIDRYRGIHRNGPWYVLVMCVLTLSAIAALINACIRDGEGVSL